MYKHSVLFRWGLLPLLTLGFGLCASLIFVIRADISPTVVSYAHYNDQELGTSFRVLEDGDLLEQSFIAREDNLGMIALNFKKESPVIGTLVFRLKPSGDADWQVTNSYDSRQFYYLSEFPFGFPIIPDSKGKKFDVQFRFLVQEEAYRASLKIQDSVLISKYKFSKHDLIKDQKILRHFLFAKMRFIYIEKSQFKHIFLYFLPFIIIISANVLYETRWYQKLTIMRWILRQSDTPFAKKLRLLLPFPYILFPLWNIAEAMLFTQMSDVMTIAVFVLWGVFIWLKKLQSTTTFIHTAILGMVIAILLPFEFTFILEKLTAYAFVFLVFAVGHSMIELWGSHENA